MFFWESSLNLWLNQKKIFCCTGGSLQWGGGGRLFFTYFYFLNISCLKIRKKYLCSLEDFVVVVVQRPFIENQKNVTK